MNHLPAQLTLNMMWGMPIMLCLINEALCACQGITPQQRNNIMQMFPVSVKRELRSRFARTGSRLEQKCWKGRAEVVSKKQRRCCVAIFHKNISLSDDAAKRCSTQTCKGLWFPRNQRSWPGKTRVYTKSTNQSKVAHSMRCNDLLLKRKYQRSKFGF